MVARYKERIRVSTRKLAARWVDEERVEARQSSTTYASSNYENGPIGAVFFAYSSPGIAARRSAG